MRRKVRAAGVLLSAATLPRPMLHFLLLLLLVVPPTPPAHPYADATRRRIATAQDERRTAVLLPFLTNKNPT
ncbi:MAG: hypothetical protein WKG07_07660 [Hymenobacter sp.]